MLGDGQVLLGKPDIELLDRLKITCKVVENQQVDRKFDSQTIKPTFDLNCRTITLNQRRSNSVDVINNNPNMLDCLRLVQIKRQTKKQAD